MQWETVIGLDSAYARFLDPVEDISGASIAFGAAPGRGGSLRRGPCAAGGSYPSRNRGAVERAIRFGLVVGAKSHPPSIFARENYFYPDPPKALSDQPV